MSKTVVVGMSGGVDSSVAAYLLKKQGYNVIGLFMLNWEETAEDGACSAATDFADVRRVCSALDIPYYSVNFADKYRERVFSHFLEEYRAGRTPNPDVLCNREIKFGPFRDYALSMGADFVATGHYCGIEHADGRHRLKKAADGGKDQTYFLNQVRESQLENVLFPLAELTKPEVRKIAEETGLATAGKKDSTGICFIGERNFKRFLSKYLPATPGNIEDTDGNVIGRHDGLMYYTLGQRRGLGLGGIAGYDQSRWFVIRKDLARNVLVVHCGEDDALFSSALTTDGFHCIGTPPAQKEFRAKVKTRYRQPGQDATVTLTPSGARILFDTPQRAVTPGQYAVVYIDCGEGERLRCLGGGAISGGADGRV